MQSHRFLQRRMMLTACLSAAGAMLSGCAAFPDKLQEPLFHNPFPQLHRVAILPFYNQSNEPTLDGDSIAIAYYTQLQTIPGFEVMPVGVAKRMLEASAIEPRSGADFQRLAQQMGVDAVIVGSVTEYSPYYPPRMGMSVDWYASNPSFHPIPAGYGLPWGTPDEEFIPGGLVQEAEFALAREQLKTQTPEMTEPIGSKKVHQKASAASATEEIDDRKKSAAASSKLASNEGSELPVEWPDPRGFVPPSPQAKRPGPRPQSEPIITHTRVYRGQDAQFTQRLEAYLRMQDDARFGGVSGYLQRPDDFVQFCCYLHVTESLAARGGAGESRIVYRWPISRYER
ncbi:MAG: hypothetical protein ACO1RA_03535 [Planctomycetaceae bacterium]